MLNIRIKTIPHSSQRYDTVGDYWNARKSKQIRISELKHPIYELLIAIHELIETFLTEYHGIREQDIYKFDTNKKLTDAYYWNPGNDPKAPYHKEHMFSTLVEKLLAKAFGICWKDYQKALDTLTYPVLSRGHMKGYFNKKKVKKNGRKTAKSRS